MQSQLLESVNRTREMFHYNEIKRCLLKNDLDISHILIDQPNYFFICCLAASTILLGHWGMFINHHVFLNLTEGQHEARNGAGSKA